MHLRPNEPSKSIATASLTQRILAGKVIPALCEATGADEVEDAYVEGEDSQIGPQILRDGFDRTNPNHFQIFIKTPSGKIALIWIQETDSVINLKNNIAYHIGYLEGHLHLLYGGRTLQDYRSIKDYNIMPESTIILNLRLRGGAETSSSTKQTEGGSGSSTKTKHNSEPHQQQRTKGISFKNILQGGISPTAATK